MKKLCHLMGCVKALVEAPGLRPCRSSLKPRVISGGFSIWQGRIRPSKIRARRCLSLYADLKGLPPLLIQVGKAETLYDDSVPITARAQGAGAVVELNDWQVPQVFQLFAPKFPETTQSLVRAHVG